jgi:ribosome-binding protein aMBF1 (putative translation factor)
VRTCDVCGKTIEGKPATSRRGRWGLDLCGACYQRLRKREKAQQADRSSFAERVQAAQADGPPYSWPLCELCGEDVDQHGLGYYTSKGKPRRFCSILCRNTANSREGAPIRAAIQQQRVKAGLWQNPGDFVTDEERREFARMGGAVRAEQHQEALDEGTWENPADAPGAREKLSRPRKHGDNPDLHRALEKLKAGGSVTDLTEAEAAAHRKYKRKVERRRRQRPPNQALAAARERAGLSQAGLARQLGVAANTVHRWERHSAIPQPENRAAAVEILGCDPWAELET